jgi:S-formylglutathione hydrolase FrmB
VFGPGADIRGTEHDLMHLAHEAGRDPGRYPPLWAWCGTDDFLLTGNRLFRRRAEQAGLDLTYDEGPGGHEWACWDREIQRVLDWLPLARDGAGDDRPRRDG